jgi:hypothetical protein
MAENKFTRSGGFVPYNWMTLNNAPGNFQLGGGLNLRGYVGYLAPTELVDDKGQVTVFRTNTGSSINAEWSFAKLTHFYRQKFARYLTIDPYLFADAGVVNYSKKGNLREFKSGVQRADIIIVSKTPPIFSPIERRQILTKINPLPHQQVFFSFIKYHSFTHFFDKKVYLAPSFKEVISKDTEVLVFAGIANPALLEDFVRSMSKSYKMISFDDHHEFNNADLVKIKSEFDGLRSVKKIILTTEKDAMRLLHLNLSLVWSNLPVFFVSIAVQMHQQDEKNFNQLILNYVRTN